MMKSKKIFKVGDKVVYNGDGSKILKQNRTYTITGLLNNGISVDVDDYYRSPCIYKHLSEYRKEKLEKINNNERF